MSADSTPDRSVSRGREFYVSPLSLSSPFRLSSSTHLLTSNHPAEEELATSAAHPLLAK
jgi:hypothetical protein